MKHARIIDTDWHEPSFDLPPRFVGCNDRRLGGRIAAHWTGRGPHDGLPTIDQLRADTAPDGRNLVWLEARGGAVFAVEVGGSVAAVFGLLPGQLPAGAGFADALHRAFDRSTAAAAPALFEGGFARDGAGLATVLTRGAVVPLRAAAGERAACAIVTWTELLAPTEVDRLHRDLRRALSDVPRGMGPTRAIW